MSEDHITINDFQRRIEERCNATLRELGLVVDSCRVFREKVPFLLHDSEVVIAIKAHDLDLGIRERSASYTISGKGDYYEMPDYPNADALADALLLDLRREWREHSRA